MPQHRSDQVVHHQNSFHIVQLWQDPGSFGQLGGYLHLLLPIQFFVSLCSQVDPQIPKNPLCSTLSPLATLKDCCPAICPLRNPFFPLDLFWLTMVICTFLDFSLKQKCLLLLWYKLRHHQHMSRGLPALVPLPPTPASQLSVWLPPDMGQPCLIPLLTGTR